MSKMDRWFRKVDPRRPKQAAAAPAPGDLFLIENGHAIAILRPEDPSKKMAGLAVVTSEKESLSPKEYKKRMDLLLSEQPHQFVGYASKQTANVLDGDGRVTGQLQPGDSMCVCGHGTTLAPPRGMR